MRGGGGASFYDLVGAGEEGLRHGKPERSGRLEVDNQLEAGRALYRQISRARALEDLIHIDGYPAHGRSGVRTICKQEAVFRPISPVTSHDDPIFCPKLDNVSTPLQ